MFRSRTSCFAEISIIFLVNSHSFLGELALFTIFYAISVWIGSRFCSYFMKQIKSILFLLTFSHFPQ